MSTWFVQTRGTIYLYRFGPSVSALAELAPHYSGHFRNLLAINIGEKFWWMWDEAELRAYGEKILKLTLHEQSREAHLKECDDAIAKAIAAAEATRNLPYRDLSNDELIAAGRALYAGAREGLGLLNFAADAFDHYPAEYIEKEIQRELHSLPEAERGRVASELLTVAYSSYLALEERAVLTAALESGSAESVASRFWWTSLGWESVETKDAAHFDARIRAAKADIDASRSKLAQLQSYETVILDRRDTLVSKHRLPRHVSELLSVFDAYAKLHDRRKEMQMRVMYSYHLLKKEACSRLGLDEELSEWLWPEELYSILSGTAPDHGELRRRQSAVAILFRDGTLLTLSGDEAVRLKERELPESRRDVSELRGMTASVGFATGVVRICAGGKDAHEKVKEGDILVTGMTLPDYVPAMKRAGAIVTDEGGITSHAAIVSRELRKPCIIGTKIATEVLRDGDVVEVDADRGMIKILMRAQ